MREFKAIHNQQELESCIVFLADDLKRRANEISNDWDKAIQEIEIKTVIACGELLKWDINKKYTAYKEKEN